jgi:hypothetical protein
MADVRLSTRGFNTVFLVTSAVLVYLFITSYQSYRVTERTLQRYTRLERVLGKIEHDNTAAVISTRFAAETGEASWSDRHNAYKIEIRSLLSEAKKLSLSGQGQNLQALEDTRESLSATEEAAIVNIRKSAAAKARLLLQAGSYQETNRIFVSTRDAIIRSLEEQTAIDLNTELQRNRLAMFISSICTVLTLLTWNLIVSMFSSAARRKQLEEVQNLALSTESNKRNAA